MGRERIITLYVGYGMLAVLLVATLFIGPNRLAFLGFVVVLAAVTGTTWAVALYFSEDAVTERNLRKAPVVSIVHFPVGGVARVTGVVVDMGERLVAPLTRRPCVYYRLLVQKRRPGRYRLLGGRHEHWLTVIDEQDGRDFLVRDDTGSALVKMTKAQVAVTKDGHRLSDVSDRATPPDLEALLAERGLPPEQLTGRVRYVEGVIEPGERITALGHGRVATQREQNVFDLVLHRARHTAVLVSDDADTVGDTFTARRRRRKARGQCLSCGYDLRGRHAQGCPECGWRR